MTILYAPSIAQAIIDADYAPKPATLSDARDIAASFLRSGETAADVTAQLLITDRFAPLWAEYGDDMAGRVVAAAAVVLREDTMKALLSLNAKREED